MEAISKVFCMDCLAYMKTIPDGEFKPGYKEDEETKARRIEKYRRWCLHHPRELKERGAKVWATRRSNMQTKGISS